MNTEVAEMKKTSMQIPYNTLIYIREQTLGESQYPYYTETKKFGRIDVL